MTEHTKNSKRSPDFHPREPLSDPQTSAEFRPMLGRCPSRYLRASKSVHGLERCVRAAAKAPQPIGKVSSAKQAWFSGITRPVTDRALLRRRADSGAECVPSVRLGRNKPVGAGHRHSGITGRQNAASWYRRFGHQPLPPWLSRADRIRPRRQNCCRLSRNTALYPAGALRRTTPGCPIVPRQKAQGPNPARHRNAAQSTGP